MTHSRQLDFDPPIDGGVVVGYDASPASARAVTVAADVAEQRKVPLHIVRAWQLSNAMADVGAPTGTVPSFAEVEAAVQASLDKVAADVRAAHPEVDVAVHVQHAKSTEALVAASQKAELLVISKRGRGGFVDLVLGSTADQVIRYAKCSVLAVRP